MNMFPCMARTTIASSGVTPSGNPKLLDGTASLKHFDIVVANPPFSLEKWGFEAPTLDKIQPLPPRVPPRTKGDYAFIPHDQDHEAGTGCMAVGCHTACCSVVRRRAASDRS